MEIIKVTAAAENIANNLEIKEANEKVKEEAKKARRALRPMFVAKIRSMIKTINESYDEKEVKTARTVLRVFLNDLAAHKTGRHAEVVKRVQTAMNEGDFFLLNENEVLVIADAAVRYDISFVRMPVR